MLIKTQGEYLDLLPGEAIEMESQVKLFEEISAADGDFTYSFRLPPTAHNKRLLSLTDINLTGKNIYSEIESDLQDSSGITLRSGLLKVEKFNTLIECSFFSGNTNWFNLIEGSIKDLDLSEYDVDNSLANVEASWTNTNGIVWPLIDKGKLSDRLTVSLVYDERLDEDLYLNNDFQPFLFVKNIFTKIFTSAGLKITGALLQDWLYQRLITTNNAGNQKESLEARSSYVGKTSAQTISSGSFTKVTWVDDSDPYYDGDNDNFSNANDRWTADVACVVRVTSNLQFSNSQRFAVAVYKNGAAYSTNDFYPQTGGNFILSAVELEAGDYLEVFAKPFTSNSNVNVGSYFRVTVIRIKKIFAVDVAPDVSKIDFIKNIFKIFNVVPTYNYYTKTVNLQLFKNIKNNTPQDLSAYLQDIEFDYFEFINNYGKKNVFKYLESSVDEIEDYNASSENEYGAGQIDLDNSYLTKEVTVADLDFTAPYQYQNDAFQASLIKMNYLGESESAEHSITSVTDSSGAARFNYSAAPFSIDAGDIIRIKSTSTGAYVGTGVVFVDSGTYFELSGVPFNDTCTGTFVKINYTENGNADPVLAVFVSQLAVSGFSSHPYAFININGTQESNMAFAYFFKHYQGGLTIDNYRQGLSFGQIVGEGYYQDTLLETYYRDFETLLIDPVKAIGTFYLPASVFAALDFTRPVRLKHGKANGLFYLNKVSGYKAKHLPCIIELIKLR